ncbi:MAG TPA: universal stress protein [Actinomycetes bacterium]|nr:universal stress protein [Actinomycetes bacterium]
MASDRDCRVVVGVDGSAASIAALRWAAQAATERDVPLCVVGVDPDVHDSTGPYLWQQSRPEDRLAALHDTLAVAVTTALGPEPDIKVSQQVEPGRPGEVLARVADKADLLVLGSRRVDADEPLRPVLRACIQLATCPVVVVADGADRQARPVTT